MRTIVHAISYAITVAVAISVVSCKIRHHRVSIADIADAVTVGIGLIGVGKERTVVYNVPSIVAISVVLVGIWNKGCVVAYIPDSVTIRIRGQGTSSSVAHIAHAIVVGIGLIGVARNGQLSPRSPTPSPSESF